MGMGMMGAAKMRVAVAAPARQARKGGQRGKQQNTGRSGGAGASGRRPPGYSSHNGNGQGYDNGSSGEPNGRPQQQQQEKGLPPLADGSQGPEPRSRPTSASSSGRRRTPGGDSPDRSGYGSGSGDERDRGGLSRSGSAGSRASLASLEARESPIITSTGVELDNSAVVHRSSGWGGKGGKGGKGRSKKSGKGRRGQR